MKDDRRREQEEELPPAVQAGVEQLGTLVEGEVKSILRAAHERAAQIERDAARTAHQLEQDAERRAAAIFKAALERAAAVLETIDAVEHGFAGMSSGLRAEADALAARLTAVPPPAHYQELVPASVEAAIAGAEREPSTELTVEGTVEPAAPAPDEQLPLPTLIRATLYKLREDGRSRAEAAALLARFRIDDLYGDLLDRVYGPPREEATGGRRRLFRGRG